MKNVHALHAFHMQRRDAIPLIEAIDNDQTAVTTQRRAESEIQAIQRQDHDSNDTNEPKVAALVQRKGQETHAQEWITAWAPCYDTDHPGPDIQDTSLQWFESPFAIETNEHHQRIRIVRGIHLHEMANIIGYDEEARYRLLQQEPETAIAQMRNTPPAQLLAAVLQGIQEAESKTGHNESDGKGTTTQSEEDEDVDDELRKALTRSCSPTNFSRPPQYHCPQRHNGKTQPQRTQI